MTLVEKVMIILAVLMPVIALMLFLPKVIKNRRAKPPKERKKKQKPTTPYVAEPTPIEAKPKVEPTTQKFSSQNHANDFKDFAERKSKRISPPKRNFPTPNFSDFEGFRPRPIMSKQSEQKTVAEEIKSLSPQLKALILSGVLDRKDFED